MVKSMFSKCDSQDLSQCRIISLPRPSYSNNTDHTPRRAKKLGYQLALTAALCYCAMKYLLVEEEEVGAKSDAPSKTQGESGDKANDGGQEDGVDEDDVEVPDVMPQNALFVPLGRPRQIPQTYYKGTDPEWQSFIDFRKDRKKAGDVQSMFASSLVDIHI